MDERGELSVDAVRMRHVDEAGFGVARGERGSHRKVVGQDGVALARQPIQVHNPETGLACDVCHEAERLGRKRHVMAQPLQLTADGHRVGLRAAGGIERVSSEHHSHSLGSSRARDRRGGDARRVLVGRVSEVGERASCEPLEATQLVFAQSLTPAAGSARVHDLRRQHRRVKRKLHEPAHFAQHGLGIGDELLVAHLEVMGKPRAGPPGAPDRVAPGRRNGLDPTGARATPRRRDRRG